MQNLELLATWIVNNFAGLLAAFAAFMAWRKSQENAREISVVHTTINSNREKDMAMAQAGGQATGIMMERDAAIALASHVGTPDASGVVPGLVVVKAVPGVEVRRADEH